MSTAKPVPPQLKAGASDVNPENVALFKAALAGSALGVENALKKGASVYYFHRPEDQKTR